MAKITANTDLVPTNGRWVWKDEPLGLEFISNTLITDKGKRGKKHEAKGKDRAASSRAIGRGRGLTHMGNARGQQLKKELFEHNTVLLEDIKSVAFDMISEVETLPESFGGVLRAPQFDYFLLHLLSYFKCYFEKRKQENKKHPMCVEPSPSEKKALAVVTEKLQAAQKLLGRSYCSLVLGLGLEKQHHMECGSSRVSATYKDRGIFEDSWISIRIGDAQLRALDACTRCVMVTVDQEMGSKDPQEEPLNTLKTFRQKEPYGIKPAFGVNFTLDNPGTIHVGDIIYAKKGQHEVSAKNV